MKHFISLLTIVTVLGGLLPLLPAAGAANPLIPEAQAGAPAMEPAAQAPAPTPTPTPVAPPPAEETEPLGTQIPEEISGVPGVTDEWWAAVQAQVRNDMYGLSPDEAAAGGPAFRGYNQAHNLEMAFSAAGLRLAPAPPRPGPEAEPPGPAALTTAAEAGLGWGWELRFTGYGYQGQVQPVLAARETSQTGNRLEYRHAGLTEWYMNDERGLEQGFTIDAPPAAGPGESLVLELTLTTDLAPLVATGQAIEFTLPGSNVILLRYGDLAASDAAGNTLPARMELAGCGPDQAADACRLRLVIEIVGAVYPLTIDPLVIAPPWSAVGENAGDGFGLAVATAGDVNGDGYDDLVVGALRYLNPLGKVYVYHGSPAGLGTAAAWAAIGENPYPHFGRAVGSAGDVNGDGYSDLWVSALPGESFSGKVYVYHGSPAGLEVDEAWSVVGENAGDYFGCGVGSAGDVNGDGYSDLVVGAGRYNDDRGKAYVYHGSPAGLEANAAWTEIGEVYAGYGAELGSAVGTAGDVNGDGYGDLVVGAKGYDYSRGKVYLYHGSATGLIQDAPADWTATGENAWDYFGGDTVGTAGDVNGDGYDDLVVGAWGYNGYRGKVNVYPGSATGLSATPVFTATGENASDEFGRSAGPAGDVNGDGYADLVVGTSQYDSFRGKAYVYLGSPAGLSSSFDWTVTGENPSDRFGAAVGTAGDVNGDGYADLIVGAPVYDSFRGKVYVYHGSALGLTPPFDWTAAGEEAADSFGYAVATAGDVNGDGYSDVAVGAYGYDAGRGRTYLYRGSAAGLAESPAWSASGQSPGERFGRAVMTAGDVNGDGYDDLVVGAWGYNNNTGRAYLYPGSAAGLAETPAWSATGQHPGDSFGLAVTAAGDVDGDRYADVVIGAAGYPGGSNYGMAYLYRGSGAGLAAAPAWSASGESAGSYFGAAVAPAGDVNGDGLADLAVGAYGYNGYRGRVYLYYGRSPGGLGAAPAFTASGANPADYLGWSLGTAGDVNGDGYSDLAVGAWGYDAPGQANAGRVSVYYGSVAGLDGSAALTITGASANAYFGTAVATAGDVDGDGYADLLAGASGYNTSAGRASLYFGSAAGLVETPTWSAAGRRAGDYFGAALGTAGDVNGDGYSDLVVGAWGYDNPGGKTNAGRAYVYHGAASGPSPTFGWSQAGENAGDHFGVVVATAGDVNGDGYGDLVVGAYGYNGGRGMVYLYHGSPAGLAETPVFSATGENVADSFGDVVGTAGDVNGDGYADLVVGALGYDNYRGKVYLYPGSPAGLAATPVFTATGQNTFDAFGRSVGTAGDVNGDGYADLVVGAPGYDGGRGKAYLYPGSAAGLAETPVFTATGENPGDQFGYAVGTAGDVNGDGYADLAVGANVYDLARGKVYLYPGSAAGLAEPPAWTAAGENPYEYFGDVMATAGDVNGDGYADLVVRAWDYDDDNRVKLYLYHGSALGLSVPLAELSGDSAAGWFGDAVGTAGDVNGDGYADLVVGGPGYDIPDNPDTPEDDPMPLAGKAYLFHGSPAGLIRDVAWGVTGVITGDRLGFSVGTAGDVNGDGFADLVVGALGFDSYRGKLYLYQGNAGGGRAALARQARGDGSDQTVQPWGPAYTPDSFQVSLRAVNPLGGGKARLQVQACPPGVPFGHAACLEQTSAVWIRLPGAGGVELKRTVSGLDESVLYRWRARALYDSPLYRHGPWRRLLGQAMEADVRSTQLPADLRLAKTMDPETLPPGGGPITFTLAFDSNGPARGVVITDLMPSGIVSISVTSSGAAITRTGDYVWQVQDLEAGDGGVITITGQAQIDRFVNSAVIAGSSPDPNGENNRATVQTRIPGIIYVDRNAGGANNGLSWANAYTDLQDALTEAQPGDQVWVAGGVYRPTPGSQRTAAFQLEVSGVRLYGGFAGSENYLHERDWVTHPTLLSGDIGTLNNPADNVYHVITASHEVTSSTLLDGFIVTGGNADGNDADGWGGGLLNQGGSPSLVNVAFVGNAANLGGGIYNADGSGPTLVNVAFSGNTAASQGGGMYNLGSTPAMTNVTFSRNAAGAGGGLSNAGGSQAALANAILWGNTPDQVANAAGSSAGVSTSDVQGGYAGAGNLNADPQFVDADGLDDTPGTLDDDLRLHTTFRHPSPVIDAGDSSALPLDSGDMDGDGDTAELLPLDLSGRWRLIGFTALTPTVDMGAYEATILDVLAEGQDLYEQGLAFRMENLQLLSSDTLAEALQNYANFNDGEWYYAFCADYNQLDADGYCNEPDNVRNTLLDSIDLYRVAVGWPSPVFTPTRGSAIPVWDSGGRGVLSATNEIANVHLIFGNEFLVDATDYRFSTGGIPYADEIIAQELGGLGQAQRQFELILDLTVRAFNEWHVGDYCTTDQFEQFGVASSLMMSTLNEAAARYYMLGQSQNALDVYDRAYREQYLHLLALDEMAAGAGGDYLQNGSWEMLNNLSQMRERAQAIHDGLDFFGFAPDYVPLQAYQQLLQLTEGPTGNTGLLGTARDLEDQARDAQRTFDSNASAMTTELDNLTVELNDQLFELCGQSQDEYETCEGGLMGQNFNAMDAASLRVGLAWLQAQNIAEQIKIEGQRAGQVIMVQLGLGQEISAADLAIGKLQALRTTLTGIMSSEAQLYAGVEAKAETYTGIESEISANPFKISVTQKSGFKASIERSAGLKFSQTWGASTQIVWDPAAEAIAGFESLKALKQAEAQADIEGANSAAVIRNLLLQQSEALEEYEIAMAEFNKLAAEHDYLAERHSRLLNKRYQAINRVASHNSHLLSPAYRIWRDSLTTQSQQAHALAAQFAYLTARAAEYTLLTPYPGLGQIFRARTSNDIRLFLDGLKVWVQALDQPGQLNRYPYTVSLARDIWGLTDQALDPDGLLSEAALRERRYREFQNRLQANVDGGKLEVWFGTLLEQQRAEDQYLFSPNVWNNRIAGLSTPLAQNEGVSLNIVTRQGSVTGDPEVVLIHGGLAGGAEAYRNAAGQIVYYDPDTAVPVGYVLPPALDPKYTTVALRPGINGAGAIPNGGLLNLSVAASSWILRIPASSRGSLDYSQIEDIQIMLDSTGRALSGHLAQAQEDAHLLQAGLELEPTDIEPVYSAPLSVQSEPITTLDLAPSLPGQVGGSYFGSVMVTSPITLAIQVLNLDLWNDGVNLSGNVNAAEASLYPEDIGLTGTAGDGTFSLFSDPFDTTVAGRTVTQVFTLTGHIEEDGDILRAAYTALVTNLLPDPILVQGSYSGSRPSAVGSQRLVVRTGTAVLPSGASTTVTATLYDETMQVMTDPSATVSFTTDWGAVTPEVETVDGVAVATFIAAGSPGQATIWATTGEFTGTARIQVGVSGLAQPVANFSASPLSGTAPLTVTFTDLSGGVPTSWAWDFGDGGTSIVQHPVYTYTLPGSYTVTLTVSNTQGTDTLTRTDYISVWEPTPPTALFAGSPLTGSVPLTVTFSDQSTGMPAPTSWTWTFGDGGSSAVQHPVHTYVTSGSFTVTLAVSNTQGTATLTRANYITATLPPPVAKFSASPVKGTVPLTVTFTDQSTGVPTSWAWDFGDDGSSTEQHPSHTYVETGTFTVTLTVTNALGFDTKSVPDYIIITEEGEGKIHLPVLMKEQP